MENYLAIDPGHHSSMYIWEIHWTEQWFSAFLMPWPFNNTVPHVVVTSNHKIILLLLHNCNFATVINHNVNIWYVTQRVYDPQVENHCTRQSKIPCSLSIIPIEDGCAETWCLLFLKGLERHRKVKDVAKPKFGSQLCYFMMRMLAKSSYL